MQNNEEKKVEHDVAQGAESDETRAERFPVGRLLANPRRVRRA